MASTINVGVMRALLTADTAQFVGGLRTASDSTLKFTSKMDAMTRGMSQAARQSASSIQMIGGMSAAGREAAANVAKVTEATAGAASGVKQFGMSLDVAKGMLGAFGISLGVSTVMSFGKALLDTSDHLVKVADRTGLTTTEVQKLQYIAGQSGNSLDELTGAVSRLQVNLASKNGGAIDAIKFLKINLDELKAATPFEQMSMIATEIAKIENPAKRAETAVAIFGRTGAAILPTLISDFKALGDEAPVMSDKTVRALEQAGDALNRAQLQMKVWAAEAFNFAGTLFDRFVIVIRRGAASLSEALAVLASGMAKLPLVGGKFDELAKKLRADAQLMRDGADATAAALNRQGTEIRKNTGALVDYEGAATGGARATRNVATEADKAAAAQSKWLSSISDLSGVFSKWVQVGNDANATMKTSMALYTAMPPAIHSAAASIEGRLIPAQYGLAAAFEATARAKAALGDLSEGGFLNGPAAIQSGDATGEVRRMTEDALEAQRDQIMDFWRYQAGRIESESFGRLGTLFLGGLGDKMSTFGERFEHWMGGIRNTFVGILDDMILAFGRDFIGGLLKSITGANLGKALGNALTGGSVGGVGAAALALNPFTLGAAAGVGLGMAIWKGGLFRGGWEGTEGNKRRDKFVAQWGPPGTGPESGFAKLAAFLTSQGRESLFSDLMSGDKGRFESSQAAIAALAAQSGKQVQQFMFGGLVKGIGAMPAVVHGGEGILTMAGMRNLGGEPALNAINAGEASGNRTVNFYATFNNLDPSGFERTFRNEILPRLKRSLQFNTDDLAVTYGRVVAGR